MWTVFSPMAARSARISIFLDFFTSRLYISKGLCLHEQSSLPGGSGLPHQFISDFQPVKLSFKSAINFSPNTFLCLSKQPFIHLLSFVANPTNLAAQ